MQEETKWWTENELIAYFSSLVKSHGILYHLVVMLMSILVLAMSP